MLAKTGANFFRSDRYQTKSQMKLRGTAQGFEFTVYVQTNTIVQSPNKFRAEIALAKPGESAKTVKLVVSDGNQVWIYRSDLKQYAVTSYKEFDKSKDSFLIGFSSLFLLSIPVDTRNRLAQGALSDPKIRKKIGWDNNALLKGGMLTVEDGEFYIYEYTDPKNGYTYSGFVEPETATLKQFQFTGKFEGLDIIMTERILRRIENPTVTAGTFNFSQPLGARKVRSLSISPFD